MAALHALPVEILLSICQELILPDLLSLHRVHRRLAAVIVANSQYLAPKIARRTFPEAQLLLHTVPGQQQDFAWLTSLVLKYTAMVLVDRFKVVSQLTRPDLPSRGIPAESELGNSLRCRIENGLRIFNDLSRISKDVYAIPSHKLRPLRAKHRIAQLACWREKKGVKKNLSPVQLREDKVLSRRMQYRKTLDRDDWEDYQITMDFLHNAFGNVGYSYWRGEYPVGLVYFDMRTGRNIAIERGNSWLNWAILHLGPYIFFQQWLLPGIGASNSLVQDVIIDMWERTTLANIDVQRRSATAIEHELRFWSINGVRTTWAAVENEFAKYRTWEFANYKTWERTRWVTRIAAPLPRSWTEDIPFFISFIKSS